MASSSVPIPAVNNGGHVEVAQKIVLAGLSNMVSSLQRTERREKKTKRDFLLCSLRIVCSLFYKSFRLVSTSYSLSYYLLTIPSFRIKVRQQLTGSSAPPPASILSSSSSTATLLRPVSTSWPSILVNMVRTEGPLSLYKGLSASLSREASYSAIRFGIYDLCKDSLLGLPILGGENGILGGKDGFGVKLGGGLMSGMIGSSIANPADLVSFPPFLPTSPSEIFPNSHYFVPHASDDS